MLFLVESEPLRYLMVVLVTQKNEAWRLYIFRIDSHCEVEGNSKCLEHKLQSKVE